MKLLILSDIHGNWPALRAVLRAEPDRDAILVLGDLVNYGPQPVECLTWAMNLGPGNWLVQGNHDRAVARHEDPHCSPAYALLARATQQATERMIPPEMRRFLDRLPPLQHVEIGELKCVLCHATPKEPLYHYLTERGSVNVWESELEAARHPHFLFVGHTHLPMNVRFRKTLVVNPGSVGQPRDGDPRAAYAIWQDGNVTLRRADYDVNETLHDYPALQLEPHLTSALCGVLRSGGDLPSEHTLNPSSKAVR